MDPEYLKQAPAAAGIGGAIVAFLLAKDVPTNVRVAMLIGNLILGPFGGLAAYEMFEVGPFMVGVYAILSGILGMQVVYVVYQRIPRWIDEIWEPFKSWVTGRFGGGGK